MSPQSFQLAPLRFCKSFPLTLAVSAAALVVAAIPSLADVLQFDRTALAAGELWRLLTCHLTHWNGEHLLWDLLMFAVLGSLSEWRDPRAMRIAVAAGILAVTTTVCVCFLNIEHYRGLSGIDTALFALLAIQLLLEARRERNVQQVALTGALLLGLAVKVAYEAVGGQTIFVEQQAAGFVPLVWDHVAGAAAGAIVAMRSGDPASPPARGTLASRRLAA